MMTKLKYLIARADTIKIWMAIIGLISVSSVYSQSNNQIVLPNYPSPVLWYDFSELEGDTVYDHSGNNIHAVTNNPSYREPGEFMYFNGTYHLDLPNNKGLNGLHDFTMAFNLASYEVLQFSKTIIHNLYGTYLNYGIKYNSLYGFVTVSEDSENVTLVDYSMNDSSFHDLVVVYKDTLASLYADGQLLRDNIIVGERLNHCSSLELAFSFHGAISEVKFYNHALNAYQVKTVFDHDHFAPDLPNTISGTQTDEKVIALSWLPAYDSIKVAGYELYRNDSLIASITDTAYFDSVPQTNMSYYYSLRAFDYSGNISDFSHTITVNVCENIRAEYDNMEVNCCPGDTLVLFANVSDKNYSYLWQKNNGSGWVNLYDNDVYSQTETQTLLIRGIENNSEPVKFRLSVENSCGIKYLEPIQTVRHDLYMLSGLILAGNKNLEDGMVYLYKSGAARDILVDSATVSYGYFYFDDVCAGEYKIKATPYGSTADVYASRFYRNGWNLSSAYPLRVYNDYSHLVITLKPIILGFEELDAGHVTVYPSVVKDNLFIITGESSQYKLLSYTITDLAGKTVLSGETFNDGTQVSLSLTAISPGMYFISIRPGNSMQKTFKILCE